MRRFEFPPPPGRLLDRMFIRPPSGQKTAALRGPLRKSHWPRGAVAARCCCRDSPGRRFAIQFFSPFRISFKNYLNELFTYFQVDFIHRIFNLFILMPSSPRRRRRRKTTTAATWRKDPLAYSQKLSEPLITPRDDFRVIVIIFCFFSHNYPSANGTRLDAISTISPASIPGTRTRRNQREIVLSVRLYFYRSPSRPSVLVLSHVCPFCGARRRCSQHSRRRPTNANNANILVVVHVTYTYTSRLKRVDCLLRSITDRVVFLTCSERVYTS